VQGAGKAGGVDISTKSLELLGGSFLSANTFGQGDAGNILITSQNLNLSDGVKISASTSRSGKGGNIIVKVKDKITLDGTNTGLFASTEKGSTGDSGSIDIDPQIFIIKNGARIGVNSQGIGKGGDISVQAGTLTLDNKAFINAATASSQGGGITLQIKDLLFMRHHSNSPAFVEWENISPNLTQVSTSPVKVTQKNTNHHPQIQQAQGWMVTPDGKVVLTADPEKVTLQADKNNLPDCK
jgi:large exoprotein involved in heme utilization and adhesion